MSKVPSPQPHSVSAPQEQILNLLKRTAEQTELPEILKGIKDILDRSQVMDLAHDKDLILKIQLSPHTTKIITALRPYADADQIKHLDSIFIVRFFGLAKANSREDSLCFEKIQDLLLKRCGTTADSAFLLCSQNIETQISVLSTLSTWGIGNRSELKSYAAAIAKTRAESAVSLRYDTLLLRAVAALEGWPAERYEILKGMLSSRGYKSLYGNLKYIARQQAETASPDKYARLSFADRRDLIHVCDTIYTLSKGGVYEPEIYKTCFDFIASNLHHLSPRDLAISAWSYSHCFKRVKSEKPSFIIAVAQELRKRIAQGKLTSFNALDSCHLAWSLAIDDPKENKVLVKTMAKNYYNQSAQKDPNSYKRYPLISEKEVVMALILTGNADSRALKDAPVFGRIKAPLRQIIIKESEDEALRILTGLFTENPDLAGTGLPPGYGITLGDTTLGIYKDALIRDPAGKKLALIFLDPAYRYFNGDSTCPIFGQTLVSIAILKISGFKVWTILRSSWEKLNASDNPKEAWKNAISAKLKDDKFAKPSIYPLSH